MNCIIRKRTVLNGRQALLALILQTEIRHEASGRQIQKRTF